jgi:hypothetical protein
MTLRRFVLAGCVAALVGCARTPLAPPVPPPAAPPASGPTATVADSARPGGGDQKARAGGLFFYVAAIDGRPTADNSREATRKAGSLTGPSLKFRPVERAVPAGPVKLTLRATPGYGSALAEFALLRRTDVVEGVVEVPIEAGKRYRVTGWLDAYRHEVWLEEEGTQRIVGNKLIGRAGPSDLARMKGASYSCCNLRYEGDWISDGNWQGFSFIPAGARIVVKDYGNRRASVWIDGWPMYFGVDHGYELETREQFVAKHLVATDPKLKLAAYPPATQSAIRAGQVMPGMTREQVVMSLGYPRSDLTRGLHLPRWIYLTRDEEEFGVLWGDDERVANIDASDAVRRQVVHVP